MDLWIPITLVAATAQTIRTAIQQEMKARLGDYAASSIRFIYAIPFSWAFFLWIIARADWKFPALNFDFALWITAGGIAQIIFTISLIRLFSYKNFLVGVAFSKTEVLLAAILEGFVFSIAIDLQFSIAIFTGLMAVTLLALRGNVLSWSELRHSLKSKSTSFGLMSGLALAFSVVCFRGAINALPESDFLIRATCTAAIVVIAQSLSMVIYLYVRHRQALKATFTLWRPGLTAGFFAAAGSVAWFSAFALHRAAPVRAVGQIELILAMGITLFVFRQPLTRIEVAGLLMLSVSILIVILH